MNWIDILKNVITQSRVKEIEDIDIDIDDDDCSRWLIQLERIIKSYKPTHKMHGKVVTNGDITGVTEEQACLIKSKLENHDGSAVYLGFAPSLDDEVEDGAGFFYNPRTLGHTLIILAGQPKNRAWSITTHAGGSFPRILLEEFIKPDEPFLQLFDDLVSFYKPYGKMIKQFSKHCKNRIFFDNYISHVARRVKKVLLMRSEQLGGRFDDNINLDDDVFERAIKSSFGGY
tara:strand:- start:653 stop:1342 length:690 start_codon:yes stop_codon:yes gene_type:complete